MTSRAGGTGRAVAFGRPVGEDEGGTLYPQFPAHNPDDVRAIVGASHGDIDRVRELVTGRPALAKASWDWGFGDWESALGAASHVGNREIAELLIEHGARPNLFTFAMFDQVEAVRAIVEANPGVQRIHGPHGITLLSHARYGKAQRVLDYLESVGDAHIPQVHEPVPEDQKPIYLGEYRYGPEDGDLLAVVEMRNGGMGIKRGEGFPRHLNHLGEHNFHPTGAPSVQVTFRVNGSAAAETMTIHDADLVVTAKRVGG